VKLQLQKWLYALTSFISTIPEQLQHKTQKDKVCSFIMY